MRDCDVAIIKIEDEICTESKEGRVLSDTKLVQSDEETRVKDKAGSYLKLHNGILGILAPNLGQMSNIIAVDDLY